MRTPRTPRRLALAAGVLLALAAPSMASASVKMFPERIPEGNSGISSPIPNVVVKCDDDELTANQRMNMQDGSCVFQAQIDSRASTLRGFEDALWDTLPQTVKVTHGGGALRMGFQAWIGGDTTYEPDETLALRVTETGLTKNGFKVYERSRTYVAVVVVNDDKRPIIKTLGKAKPPVNAAESQVERYPWDDGTSVGANCITQPTTGFRGAFGAWGAYVPGCMVQVTCPADRACVAHARSTITSTGEEQVTLNQLLVAPGHRNNTSCAGTQECTAADDSVRIDGGKTAMVQCNGVHAVGGERGGVTCTLDLEFVE